MNERNENSKRENQAAIGIDDALSFVPKVVAQDGRALFCFLCLSTVNKSIA